MREMAMSLDTQADELENIDFDGPDDFDQDEPEEPQAGDFGTNDEYEDAYDEWEGEHDEWTSLNEETRNEIEVFKDTIREEAQSAIEGIEFYF
jgi:hypothetical protein